MGSGLQLIVLVAVLAVVPGLGDNERAERRLSMSSQVRACRLTVYLGNADIHQHKALSGEIVHRAHRASLLGATTLQGIEGYGHSAKIHTIPRWGLVDRTPITVHIIDTPDRIRAFLPQLDDLAGRCLIVCDEVDVLAAAGQRTDRTDPE